MNKNGVKLLAAIMVLAVALSGVIVLENDVSASTGATGVTLDISGAVPGYDSFVYGDGLKGSDLSITNAGLGNDIIATYDSDNNKYTISGTFNKQNVSYNKSTNIWSGTITNDSAKGFYSLYPGYTDDCYGFVLKFNVPVTMTVGDAEAESKTLNGSPEYDTDYLLYLTSTKILKEYTFTDAENNTCKVVFSKNVTLSESTVTSVTGNALNGINSDGTYIGIGSNGGSWQYVMGNTGTTGALTLKNYNGTQYFDGRISTLTIDGASTITVTDSETSSSFGAIKNTSGATVISGDKLNINVTLSDAVASTGTPGYESNYRHCAIMSAGALTIKSDLDIKVDGTIVLDANKVRPGVAVYGVYSVGALTFGDSGNRTTSDKNVNIDVFGKEKVQSLAGALSFAIQAGTGDINFYDYSGEIRGGNRAIYKNGSTTAFDGCDDLKLYGSEKAIQAKKGGTVSLVNSAITTGLINPNMGSNGGVDDYFSIKASTLTVDANSTLIAQGLRIYTTLTNSGMITVTGDYTQNPNSVGSTSVDDDMLQALIAGLYYQGTDIVDAVTDKATVGKVYLKNDAQTYGKIKVGDQTQTTSDSNSGSAISGDFATNDQITVTGKNISGTITVPKDKTLVISQLATFTNDAKIVFADGANIQIDAANGVNVTLMNGSDATTADKIELKNVVGNFSVSYGSIKINGDVHSGIIDVSGDIEITGQVTGNVTLNVTADTKITFLGTVDITGTLDIVNTNNNNVTILVAEDDVLNITGELKLSAKVKMNNDGQIIGGGIIDVPKDAQFYTSKPVSVNFSGNGTIILEDAVEELELGKILGSVFETKPTQKVIATQNLTIAKDQYLVITGGLYIPEGVTITIADGGLLMLKSPTAYAEIDGTIKSNGRGTYKSIEYAGFTVASDVKSDVIINGTIIASKPGETSVVSVDIAGNAELTGKITVNSKAKANFGKLVIAETGALENNGTISGTLYNQGSVIINGAVDASGMIVYQNAVTGIIDIQNLKGGVLTVSDKYLYLRTDDSTKILVGDADAIAWGSAINSISFSNTSGVKVTEDLTYKTNNDGTRDPINNMYIEGSFSIADSKTTSYNPAITVLAGTITVSSEFTLTKAVMTVSSDAELKVTGTMYVDDADLPTDFTPNTTALVGPSSGNKGAITVTGLLRVTSEELNTSKLNITAVMYTNKIDNKDIYYYTNLADAIASGEKELTVLGNLYVFQNTEIPNGIEIDASGKNVYVGSTDYADVTLTVKNGGFLAASGITVSGTFVIENTDTGIDCSNIVSDTSKIGETDAMYTNIYTALASAGEGDVVKVTNKNDVIFIAKDVTIPAGATLEIPAIKTVRILEGVTMTVNGTLLNKGTVNAYKLTAGGEVSATPGVFDVEPIVSEVKKAVIKVNGTIESMDKMSYAYYNISGAYYMMKMRYFITPIEAAAEVIGNVEEKTVDIYGISSVGSVTFNGTVAIPAIVNVHGNITAESFLINNGKIVIDEGMILNGSFGSSQGTVDLKNCMVKDDNNLGTSLTFVLEDTVMTVNDKDVQTLYIGGPIVHSDAPIDAKKATSITINGTVNIKAFDFDGLYNSKSGSITIATGSSVIISDVGYTESSLTMTNSKLVVSGDMLVKNGADLSVPNVYVYGTMTVTEQSETVNAAGTTTITNLYIGGDTSTTVGDAATVNGKIGTLTALFMFPGATVTGYLEEKVNDPTTLRTDLYVEDSIWMTVYKMGVSNVEITKYTDATTGPNPTPAKFEYKIKPTVKEKQFNTWMYKSSGKYYPVKTDESTTVGQYDALYADIKYNVYDVEIYVCEGIDNVYIDGVIVEGLSITGSFSTAVTAGEHTVTYTLTNGYSGTATMYIDDKKVDGMKFTAGGDFGTGTEYMIKLQGIEKSGYVPDTPDVPAPVEPTKDDSLGITEYLLIVLVVLAAILVVVVAIRMMRS